MLDQGVHVAQAGSQAEHLDVVHHDADSIHAALDVGAHHAAEAAHLLLGDLMSGMALQTGVDAALDGGIYRATAKTSQRRNAHGQLRIEK